MRTDDLLTLAKIYAAHVQRSLSTVSTRVGVNNRFFVRLDEGKGCHISAYEQVITWFDRNWPADLDWPPSVKRPTQPQKRRRAA